MNAHLCRLTFVAALVSIVLSSPGHAQPAQKVWAGSLMISDYDCSRDKVTEIVVSGDVTLSYPGDKDPQGPAPWIKVYCDKLTFQSGSSLSINSNLDLRIAVLVSGPIKIRGLRGVAGSDASPTPGIWGQRKAVNGADGQRGGDGQNAISTSWDYPAGRDSSAGDGGGNGGHGANGMPGVKGAFGKPGANGSSVNLLAGSFASGTSIDITSRGGDGGAGGRGGRGEDGGDGGLGGHGGNGGKADLPSHAASRGGNGGRGGDGGNGGNGGAGGDGGNGGRGGDIVIGLKDGGGLPVTAPFFDNQGGRGGAPGVGGEGGLKGLGRKGGDGGDGGGGERWGIGTGGGPNGLAGAPGHDGVDGREGPLGNPGKDGDRGNIGDGHWGTLPADLFRGLMKS